MKPRGCQLHELVRRSSLLPFKRHTETRTCKISRRTDSILPPYTYPLDWCTGIATLDFPIESILSPAIASVLGRAPLTILIGLIDPNVRQTQSLNDRMVTRLRGRESELQRPCVRER